MTGYGSYEASPGPVRTRRRPRRSITVACWVIALGVLIPAPAWLVSGWGWTIDLVANLNAQLAIAGTVAALVCLALRRRGPAACAALATLLMLLPLALDRAAWWPRAAAVPRPAQGDEVVRVLHYNARSRGTHEQNLALIAATNPDIVSLVGPGLDGQVRVIYGDGLTDRFPGKLVRPWSPGHAEDGAQMVSAAYLVSRWPIEPLDLADQGEAGQQVMAGVVQRPGPAGWFGVVALHPRSPRTAYRWERGNLTVDAAVAATDRLRQRGLPVLVISDLNSTPSGYRCRVLAAAGLRRGKPVFDPSGTYPEEAPIGLSLKNAWSVRVMWPLKIAIDDVWCTPGVRVEAWSVLPATGSGSEHRPILVDLRVSGPAESAGSEKQPTKDP